MLRLSFACGLCALALSSIAAAAPRVASSDAGATPRDVLAALNAVRTRPASLLTDLAAYRGYFRANLVVVPGERIMTETLEGRAPVDEAIRFLRDQPARPPLAPSEMLRRAAADHVAEQARSGRTGHFGSEGSNPGDRVARHGGGEQVAEVIAYGARDADEVIRLLLVDDGVPDRGHRVLMFADHLRYAGVACGPHPRYRTMCVIDMSSTPDGVIRDGQAPARVAVIDGADPS